MRKGLAAVCVLFIGLSINVSHGAEARPTLNVESITSENANKIVIAAVVGRDGNLIAFLRNPLSDPHTVDVSIHKATSSASLQASTSSMKSRTDLNYAPGILLIVGGVPMSIGGNFYGGAAVAGADPEIDEKCVETGIKAVQETLEFSE